jgi:hypothetical protein
MQAQITMTAAVHWPATDAEQLNGLELLAPPFLSREKWKRPKPVRKQKTLLPKMQ